MSLYSSINRKDFSEDHIVIYGRMMGFFFIPLLMGIPMGAPLLHGVLIIFSIPVNTWHYYSFFAVITLFLYSPLMSFCCRYKLEIENSIVTFRITYLGYTTTDIIVPLEKVTIEDVQVPDVIPTLYYHNISEISDNNLVFALDPWSVGDDIVIFYKQKELILSADQRKFENQLWKTICAVFKDIHKIKSSKEIV